jgi:hypothetical protein
MLAGVCQQGQGARLLACQISYGLPPHLTIDFVKRPSVVWAC